MSDDLRAAAERLLSNAYDDGGIFEDQASGAFLVNTGQLDFSPQKSADQGTLARAYIAEHPADDGEPVTEEWMRSVGFRDDGVHLSLRGFGPDRNGSIQYYPEKYGGGWIVNGTRTFDKKTRRDVRDLAKCLGVELKENNQ